MTFWPTTRLLRLATAGLLVSVAGMSWPWLLVLGVLAGVFVLGHELLELDGRSPIVAVQAPSRVRVGQAFEATVGAMPRGRTWFRVRVRLETDPGLDPVAEVCEEKVGGCGSHRFTMKITARRRGEAEIRAVWVRVTGPMGLLESVHRVPVGRSIRVSPNPVAVRQLSIAAKSKSAHAGGMPAVTTGAGTEFDELRPYVAGMDSRSIDWKSSARHRELRIRRYRQEQNQQLVLMLDNHCAGGDQAALTGLALANTALTQGDRVALQLFGTEPRGWVPFGHGARHLQRLVSALGEHAPETVASNPVHAAHALAVRLRRRSMIVVFTDVSDPVRADLVAQAVRVLQARHRVLVVALRDPHDDDMPRPENLEDVARALLWRNLHAERNRATARLRAAGVSVIAAGPRRVAGALMQKYQAGKQRVG